MKPINTKDGVAASSQLVDSSWVRLNLLQGHQYIGGGLRVFDLDPSQVLRRMQMYIDYTQLGIDRQMKFFTLHFPYGFGMVKREFM